MVNDTKYLATVHEYLPWNVFKNFRYIFFQVVFENYWNIRDTVVWHFYNGVKWTLFKNEEMIFALDMQMNSVPLNLWYLFQASILNWNIFNPKMFGIWSSMKIPIPMTFYMKFAITFCLYIL